MLTTLTFAGHVYVTSGWVETLFRCLLWLAAFDPDPWPRSAEVKLEDVRRFPPWSVCVVEFDRWDEMVSRIERLLESGEVSAGPWRMEVMRDHERAKWHKTAWGCLKTASANAPDHRDRDCRETALLRLGQYRDMVGFGPYINGWVPPRVRR